MRSFETFFEAMTGHLPRRWQSDLGEAAIASRLIRVPTGFGKTAGVVAAWAYHALENSDARWPRRLVFCLPMRVLVEQVEAEVRGWMQRLGRLWDGGVDPRPAGAVGVHLLMGGASADEWHLHPEFPAILIGTQDMLLSRALNRGYGSPRARWPMEFAQLHQDALWVLDEVQLMDVGLATSVQLQAFRAGRSGAVRPTVTWWMSATLQTAWFRTVDAPVLGASLETPLELPVEDQGSPLAQVSRRTELVAPDSDEATARMVVDAHDSLADGEFGRITLVVVNRVERAVELHRAISSLTKGVDVRLVHSRFRPAERAHWKAEFLGREHCRRGVDRILVATQVVEAGVDVSASTLVTDLAPWPSLVQRVGRVARYSSGAAPTQGRVVVLDTPVDDKSALPYDAAELLATRDVLSRAIEDGEADLGMAGLTRLEGRLSDEERRRLYPYVPPFVLRRRELLELFDTTLDTTGADVDVSRFIRTSDDRDVQVAWRPSVEIEKHLAGAHIHREELCGVPVGSFRDWVKRKHRQVLVRDYLAGEWRFATADDVIPGRVFACDAAAGGYEPALGWSPKSKEPVPVVSVKGGLGAADALAAADESADDESLSATEWQSIGTHGYRTAAFVRHIAAALNVEQAPLFDLAARVHDYGKAHPAFQGRIALGGAPARDQHDWAKAPQNAWRRSTGRPGFRHELASVLGVLDLLARVEPDHPAFTPRWPEVERQPEPVGANPLLDELRALPARDLNLVLWLVLCHHGKIRCSLAPDPRDSSIPGAAIRGVLEGDSLPPVEICDAGGGRHRLPETHCSLTIAGLGLSETFGPSWAERVLDLLEHHGPFDLAYYETLLRVADVRASRNPGEDR